MKYNAEKRAWRGRSHKNGRQVRDLRSAYLADDGSEAPSAAPVEKTFVVLVVVSGREHGRFFCLNATEALSEYIALKNVWSDDDRLDYIEIRDADGNVFRPTVDLSGICGARYELPLIMVQALTE